PAFDGGGYTTTIVVRTFDNQLGTVDQRSLSVRVCASSSSCSNSGRPYPAYAPISGPNSISDAGWYSWTASYAGPSEGYTVRWQVSYDAGATFSSLGSDQSVSFYVASSDQPYYILLQTNVTTQSGATGTSFYWVNVNTACPGMDICPGQRHSE